MDLCKNSNMKMPYREKVNLKFPYWGIGAVVIFA